MEGEGSGGSVAGGFSVRSVWARERSRSIPGVWSRRLRGAHADGQSFLRPEKFRRIFRLRPFAQQSPRVEPALRGVG